MTWHYNLLTTGDGFKIVEVYVLDDGRPVGYTDVTVNFDDIDDAVASLNMMLRDITKWPPLDAADFDNVSDIDLEEMFS